MILKLTFIEKQYVQGITRAQTRKSCPGYGRHPQGSKNELRVWTAKS